MMLMTEGGVGTMTMKEGGVGDDDDDRRKGWR